MESYENRTKNRTKIVRNRTKMDIPHAGTLKADFTNDAIHVECSAGEEICDSDDRPTLVTRTRMCPCPTPFLVRDDFVRIRTNFIQKLRTEKLENNQNRSLTMNGTITIMMTGTVLLGICWRYKI